MSEKTTKSDVLSWILSHKTEQEPIHLPLMYENIEAVNRNVPDVSEIRIATTSLQFLIDQNDNLINEVVNMEALNDRKRLGEDIIATWTEEEIEAKKSQLMANYKQMLNVIENLW